MTNATDSITDSTNAAIAFSLIDADVHNYPNTIADLTPYLPTRWQEYATQSGLQLPGVSLYPKVFAHAARRDAWPPSGDKPGSNPAFAAEQLLDAWSIERAILNPLVAASALHNYELANVMARAGNEWTAAQWLDADPRWRASIAVNIRDPEAAAAESALCLRQPSHSLGRPQS